MKNVFLLLLALVSFRTVDAQSTWTADVSHSSLGFSISHMVVSETEGRFNLFNGKVVSKNDDFTDAQIDFTVEVKSVNTENQKRDDHLKGPDFFDAEKFPKMTFKSTSFKKISDKNYKLEGDLTIKGVTKKATFDVVYNGQAKSPYGKILAGFKATGKINRFDYGLTWSKSLDTGGLMVGDEVAITVKLEMVKE